MQENSTRTVHGWRRAGLADRPGFVSTAGTMDSVTKATNEPIGKDDQDVVEAVNEERAQASVVTSWTRGSSS